MDVNPCSLFLLGVGTTCAKSVVLPADFMASGGAAPLSAVPPEPASSTKTAATVSLIAGAAIIAGGVLYLMSRHGTVLANPGRAAELGFTAADADPEQLRLGTEHEMEHTSDRRVARQTALDHLAEDSHYYTHLLRMETAVKAEETFGKWDWWRDPKAYEAQ